MLKKFLLVMGVVFTAMVGGCMFMVGGAAISAYKKSLKTKRSLPPWHGFLALGMSNDLKPHFGSSALSQINFSAANSPSIR